MCAKNNTVINLRSSCWQFIAYPDPDVGQPDNNHFLIGDILANLECSGAKVAFAFHDKDDAVPHYHFICVWQRDVYMSTLQQITGHTSRNAYLRFHASELPAKVRYLTHKDNPDKSQYPDDAVSLIGYTDIDYDMLVSSQPKVILSRDDTAQRMVDLCRAYVSRQLTLDECISHLPCIAFNVRNFLTMADALRVERAEDARNEAIAFKADAGASWRSYLDAWQEWQRK